MDDEFDNGLDSDFDAPESLEPDTYEPPMDVDSFMDDVPDAPDCDFGEFEDSFDNGLDIDSIMDEAALDVEPTPEMIEEIPDIQEDLVLEEIPEIPVEDIPENPEIPEENVAEDISEILKIPEENVVEDIPEIPEIPEENVAEDVPEISEVPADEVAEDVTITPEETIEAVGEDIPLFEEETTAEYPPDLEEEVSEEDLQDQAVSETEDLTGSDMPPETDDDPQLGENADLLEKIPGETLSENPPVEVIEEIPVVIDGSEPEGLVEDEIMADSQDNSELLDIAENELEPDMEDSSETEDTAESNDAIEENKQPEQAEFAEAEVPTVLDSTSSAEQIATEELLAEMDGEIPPEELPDPNANSDVPGDGPPPPQSASGGGGGPPPPPGGGGGSSPPPPPIGPGGGGPPPPTPPSGPPDSPYAGSGSAFDAMFDYIDQHGYGQKDYEIYSKDPEWQRLNNDLLVELGREPIDYSALDESPTEPVEFAAMPAQNAMAEYLGSHNYGREDYEIYSKDPEWQRLNNDLLVEMGEEPIEYPTTPDEAAEASIFGPKPAQNAMADYLSEHNYGREDYEIYSKDPEWQRLNNDLLAEMGEEPIDYSASLDQGTERIYDDFEKTILEANKDFYESGSFYVQGVNELGYTGTCGETSMANTINRVLGTNEFTENKVLNVAVQEGLCDTDSFPDGGGTTTKQFMDLYEKMNEQCGGQLDVQCHDFENVLSMEEVAKSLEEGCTINVAVDSNTLWDLSDPMGSPFPETRATDHWITVTGVHRGDNGIIEGFDIVDSGGGVNYVDADKYQAMCYGTEDLNLTDPTCIVVKKAGEIPSDVSQTEPIQDIPPLGPLKPNDTYESNGYTYRTDAAGRIISASGELHLCETMDRDPAAQLQAGGDSRERTDDGGHLIATRFGGSPGLDNLVAENSFINRSQYKQLENAWARDLAAGNRVIVNIEPYYGGDIERPTHITGSYTVIRPDGKSFSDSFSLTNDDLRAEEYQMDFDDGDSSFYDSLSPEEREAYEEAMGARPLKIDEGRMFE